MAPPVITRRETMSIPTGKMYPSANLLNRTWNDAYKTASVILNKEAASPEAESILRTIIKSRAPWKTPEEVEKLVKEYAATQEGQETVTRAAGREDLPMAGTLSTGARINQSLGAQPEAWDKLEARDIRNALLRERAMVRGMGAGGAVDILGNILSKKHPLLNVAGSLAAPFLPWASAGIDKYAPGLAAALGQSYDRPELAGQAETQKAVSTFDAAKAALSASPNDPTLQKNFNEALANMQQATRTTDYSGPVRAGESTRERNERIAKGLVSGGMGQSASVLGAQIAAERAAADSAAATGVLGKLKGLGGKALSALLPLAPQIEKFQEGYDIKNIRPDLSTAGLAGTAALYGAGTKAFAGRLLGGGLVGAGALSLANAAENLRKLYNQTDLDNDEALLAAASRNPSLGGVMLDTLQGEHARAAASQAFREMPDEERNYYLDRMRRRNDLIAGKQADEDAIREKQGLPTDPAIRYASPPAAVTPAEARRWSLNKDKYFSGLTDWYDYHDSLSEEYKLRAHQGLDNALAAKETLDKLELPFRGTVPKGQADQAIEEAIWKKKNQEMLSGKATSPAPNTGAPPASPKPVDPLWEKQDKDWNDYLASRGKAPAIKVPPATTTAVTTVAPPKTEKATSSFYDNAKEFVSDPKVWGTAAIAGGLGLGAYGLYKALNSDDDEEA